MHCGVILLHNTFSHIIQVEELESIYQPFEATPSEWMGCKGSSAQYRGYPCSVWQLFHSLMVNAALKGDPSMVLGGSSSVAKAMVNYVHYFFSCRHCAENFRLKVETLGGFLPNTPRDSILWLWQIHNMANVKLRGNKTRCFLVPVLLFFTEMTQEKDGLVKKS